MPTVDPDNRTHPEIVRQVERDGSMPQSTEPLPDDDMPPWWGLLGAVLIMLALATVVHLIVSRGWL